jgi:alpha-N-arabinofuranosidase
MLLPLLPPRRGTFRRIFAPAWAGRLLLGGLLAGALAATATAAEPLEATATIDAEQPLGVISKHLYGHFAEHLGRCIYDGIWVGPDSPIPHVRGIRQDVIEALRDAAVPNLRWPGGCFADDYHWRDGIGPREQRPRRVNIHWGSVVDTNAFGTHEFLDLCELIGAEPYLAGNVGSGTPQEMRDWIEYMTYDGDSELANLRRANGREKPWKIRYFGVGNENWGCGGQMRPEFYADLFRQFAGYCRDFSGNRLERIACGPSGFDPNWTRALMQRSAGQMQGYSLHYYTVAAPWHAKLKATGFDEAQWFGILKESLRMREAIGETLAIMDEHDPQHRIGLYVDEWGTWYESEPDTPPWALFQQNTLRDALVAGLTFHVFHEQNERVRMANIAQTVNVLQAMLLTEGERLVKTPTYHVFRMFRVHHDATRLSSQLKSPDYAVGDQSMPALSLSASRAASGAVHVSLVNAHARENIRLTAALKGVTATQVEGETLTAEQLDAHNTFAQPERLTPQPLEGAKIVDGVLTVEVPARSVVVLELR